MEQGFIFKTFNSNPQFYIMWIEKRNEEKRLVKSLPKDLGFEFSSSEFKPCKFSILSGKAWHYRLKKKSWYFEIVNQWI